KNSDVAGELGKILENRAVEKEYLAIVHGHVRDENGLIDAPLGKDQQSAVAIKDCVRTDGAPAQTEFSVIRRFSRPSTLNPQPSTFSLLRVLPRTGRKHQIRIHLAHIGHPIVGDKLYGSDEQLYLAFVKNQLTQEQRIRLILENQALHARAVRFAWRAQPMEFCCEPDAWYKEFANCIQLQ
ncbi:MAG TPA: RNA pseudouridine synthase, partial [Verrucomicrobiae bacterium]|nr:RNA pseudouridine synthase [Verrucomicrobiae bacterium]